MCGDFSKGLATGKGGRGGNDKGQDYERVEEERGSDVFSVFMIVL